jgi:hypothetical protein
MRLTDLAHLHAQVQQVKKSPRWGCTRCGCKQTLLKAYAISDRAKDVRIVVTNLNAAQGEAQEQQALAQLGAVEALEQHEFLNPHGEQRQQSRTEEQPVLWGAAAESAAATCSGGPRAQHAGGAGPAPHAAWQEYLSEDGGDRSGDQDDECGEAGGVVTTMDGWAGAGARGGRGGRGGRRRAREERASLESPQQPARRWQGQQQGLHQPQQGQHQGQQQGQHQPQGQQPGQQQQHGQQRGQHLQHQGQGQQGRHQPQPWQQQQQQPGVPRTAAHVQPARTAPWHAAPAQPARTTAPAPAPAPSTDPWAAAAAPQPRPQPLPAAGAGGGGGGAGGQALRLPAHQPAPSRTASKAPARTSSKWAAFVASDGEEGDHDSDGCADQDCDGRRFCLAL